MKTAMQTDADIRPGIDRTDLTIAQDVRRALRLCSTVPDGVQAVVRDGHVTLIGLVEWRYQMDGAARAVRPITGVRDVLNHITVVQAATRA